MEPVLYENFYLKGKSVNYWSKEFYKKTEYSRKQKLWRPKVENLCKSKFLDLPIEQYSIIDIGGGYGSFAERMLEKNPKNIFKLASDLDQYNKERQILEKDLSDFLLIMDAGNLEKKSKLRNFF